MRIDIVGLPASGKSTLAKAISEKLSIPHIHLDRFWFESGGRQGRHDTPNLEEVRASVRKETLEAIQKEDWVSDGTYLHVQDEITARADIIVFLDIPLRSRLVNHARRVLFETKQHGELNLWSQITFFKEIIKRTYASGPKLRRFVEMHSDKTIVLHSRKEVDQYLERI